MVQCHEELFIPLKSKVEGLEWNVTVNKVGAGGLLTITNSNNIG